VAVDGSRAKRPPPAGVVPTHEPNQPAVQELRGHEASRERSRTTCDRRGDGAFKTTGLESTAPAFSMPRHEGRVSPYRAALEREVDKRIAQHGARLRRRAIGRRSFEQATGTAATSPSSCEPAAWAVHPQFNPFRVRQRLDTIEFTIRTKLRDGTYKPMPMLEMAIEKPGGGTRTVAALPIPDAAVSNLLFAELMDKYAWHFSAQAFAYRSDRNYVDAIHYLYRELRRHDDVWLAEADFAGYFDSLRHDYLLRILRDEFRVTRHELGLVEKFLTCPRARSVDDYRAHRFYVPERGIAPRRMNGATSATS